MRNDKFENLAKQELTENMEFLTFSNKIDVLFFINTFKDTCLTLLKENLTKNIKQNLANLQEASFVACNGNTVDQY